MKCPKCGFENLEEASFCIKCGARIDGKIPCPKCQEYIPNDVEHCPHCGKAIPHRKVSDEALEQANQTKRDKVSNVFNFVSCFVTLFIFVIAITSTFLRHFINYYGDPFIDFVPNAEFIDSFKSSSGSVRAGMLTGLIICAIDFVVCLVFSIIGIVKSAKAFKDRSKIIDAYKYMVVVLVSNIVTYSLLRMSHYSGSYLYSHSNVAFYVLSIIHLFVCIAFDCFLHFKKGAVSIFIARIILGVGIALPLLILNSIGESYVWFANGETTYVSKGLIEHFAILTGKLIVDGPTAELVSDYILCSSSMIFMIIIVSLTYSFTIYYVVSYFRGMNKFRKFRIAFYMSNIALSIFATIYFISSEIEYLLFKNYLGNTAYSGHGNGPALVFALSLLLVGVAVATFNIYHRAARRARLEEKTTKV